MNSYMALVKSIPWLGWPALYSDCVPRPGLAVYEREGYLICVEHVGYKEAPILVTALYPVGLQLVNQPEVKPLDALSRQGRAIISTFKSAVGSRSGIEPEVNRSRNDSDGA